MANNLKRIAVILLSSLVTMSVILGVALGLAMGGSRNFKVDDYYRELEEKKLPSKILDQDGIILKELFEEQRSEVQIDELPKHLIYALLSREDKNFYRHNGFDIEGFSRAVVNILLGRYTSGGSTITMQVAGKLYDDRSDRSIFRKIREIWYSWQMEKIYTKDQILEYYLNTEFFGHQTYGVEAASQFYFKKSARDISIAEAAILVTIVARPSEFTPLKNFSGAKLRQEATLKQMVKNKYITQEAADASLKEFLENWDQTRSADDVAIFNNQGEAPYFTSYVYNDLIPKQILVGETGGGIDIYTSGLTIHTTLNSNFQAAAERVMDKGIALINESYKENKRVSETYASNKYASLVGGLALVFDIPSLYFAGEKERSQALVVYDEQINPILDILGMMGGFEDLRTETNKSFVRLKRRQELTTVEGALVTLENDTGYILAMYGGSDFTTKKYNRATQGALLPGSTFKPLYYAEAIESKKLNAASLLWDREVEFTNDDGTKYSPDNYNEYFRGPVLLRRALALSLNIPSLQVLESITIERGIQMAAKLLGREEDADDTDVFPRKFPVGLGISPVSPLQMAQAYATFPNQGRKVEPIAVRYIEDRNGKIIVNWEEVIYSQIQGKQLLSEQAAYIMVDILKDSVRYGTLSFRTATSGGFGGMPMAGKTGTTQNWEDAWTMGFSPYFTTAIWFGFDTGNESLTKSNTGASAAGPRWIDYMQEIHRNIEPKEFAKPATGLSFFDVSSLSGLLPTAKHYSQGLIKGSEIFITGTEPKEFDTLLADLEERNEQTSMAIMNSLNTFNLNNIDSSSGFDLSIPLVDDVFRDVDYQPGETVNPTEVITPENEVAPDYLD
jgi:penicillin-binding protein 1A